MKSAVGTPDELSPLAPPEAKNIRKVGNQWMCDMNGQVMRYNAATSVWEIMKNSASLGYENYQEIFQVGGSRLISPENAPIYLSNFGGRAAWVEPVEAMLKIDGWAGTTAIFRGRPPPL